MKNKIKEIRKAKGMTQEELAFKCFCARETIANIENGKNNPSLELADLIAVVLQVNVYEIFEMNSAAGYRIAMIDVREDEREKCRDSVVNWITEDQEKLFEMDELESFLGENLLDFDIDAIIEEATYVNPRSGNRYWKPGIDLSEIALKHDLAAKKEDTRSRKKVRIPELGRVVTVGYLEALK